MGHSVTEDVSPDPGWPARRSKLKKEDEKFSELREVDLQRMHLEDTRAAAEADAREALRLAKEEPPADVRLPVPPSWVTNGATGIHALEPVGYPCTDTGNAERFRDQHGHRVRYCYPFNAWFTWDGKRWLRDKIGEVELLAKETVRSIGEEALAASDDKLRKRLFLWAAKSEDAKRRFSMITLARCEPGVPVSPLQLDRDPWLLNLQNGTVDLRAGKLRAHAQEDLITKLAEVDFEPAAVAPTWDAFLARMMGGDEKLTSFLQRVAGCVLSGDVSAEVAFFFVGTGSNGKSTFLRALQDMLGDYARSASTELLIGAEKTGATPERMALKGARLAVASETAEGKGLNSAALKQITSRDLIVGRELFQGQAEFKPTHKMFIATNHKPRVRTTDLGTWRRILLVPFRVIIPEAERDPHLLEKLTMERAGILAWAMRGCSDWQKRGGGLVGLAAPEEVKAATRAYRDEENELGPFLAELCELSATAHVNKPVLLAAYQRWATENHEEALSSKAFNSRISELQGVASGRMPSVRFWRGIGIQGAKEAQQSLSIEAQKQATE